MIQQGNAKPGQAEWGEPVQGVRVRLRAEKARWGAGEVPTFRVDVSNQGGQALWGCRIPQGCLIEVDGKWYPDHSTPVTCPASRIEAGAQSDGWLRFSLGHLVTYHGGDFPKANGQGR